MDSGQWIGKKARIRKGLLLAIHHPLPTVRSLNEYYGVNTSPRAHAEESAQPASPEYDATEFAAPAGNLRSSREFVVTIFHRNSCVICHPQFSGLKSDTIMHDS
jgi:hypothetical protein